MSLVCAFTGHREIPNDKILNIRQKLNYEIDKAIAMGCKHFICGGAPGFDTMAARIVTEKIDYDNSITLSLILPYRGFVSMYEMAYLMPYCSNITYVAEEYHISNFYKRNRAMVNRANMVIAYYDYSKKGGTAYTVDYARSKNIPVVEITPYSFPSNSRYLQFNEMCS